jgi:cytochrome c oxidase cbb3-type subunit I
MTTITRITPADRVGWIQKIATPALEQKDKAMQVWLFSGVFWLTVMIVIGLLEAVKLFVPDFLGGIPALAYGRLRPVHTNIGMFGFMSMGYLGAAFYMIPRLTRTALFSETLGVLTAWAWNLNLLGGVIAIMAGYTKGKEYEELPFPFDMSIGLLEILIAGNLFSTVVLRRERQVYVSVWYVLLALIPFPIYYTLGNMRNFRGVEDAIINWFYSHNLFGIWLTALGLATLYYIVPKQANKPLVSHAISFLGFWTLAAFYPWNGGHHMIWGPVPMWVMTASVTASIAMFVPTIATMVNFGGTAFGTWDVIKRDVGYRFSLLAYACYVGTSLWGSVMAIMGLNAKYHFSSMTIAHVHLGFIGFGVSGLVAFIYYYLERGRQLVYSRSLAEGHFWLTAIGVIGYTLSMGILGYLEGNAWFAGESVQSLLPMRYGFNVARAMSGCAIVLGQCLFLTNLWRTLTQPEALLSLDEEVLVNEI